MSKKEMHKVILALKIQEDRVALKRLVAVILYAFYRKWEKCEVSTVVRVCSKDKWYVGFLKWEEGISEVWPDDTRLVIERRGDNKVIYESTFDEARADCIAEVMDA